MTKDYLRGQGYVKAPKIEKELGVGKDGMQQGGIPVEICLLYTSPSPRDS